MARRQQSAPEEPKQRKIALAFAGPGDTTIENTTDLLDDFLGIKDGEVPDEDVLDLRIAFPVTRDHLSPGLKSVIKWTDKYELAYDAVTDADEEPTKTMADILDLAEDVSGVKNVEKSLIDWLQNAQEGGFEARLVLLWGEEGDENAETLLDLATSFEIKALDLTAGLDDISFGDDEVEEEPTPEPEPEPEPEKPARRSRRRTSSNEDTEETSSNEDTPAEEEKPKRSRSRKKAEAEPEPPKPVTEVHTEAEIAQVLDRETFPSATIAGKTSPLQSKSLGRVSVAAVNLVEEIKGLPESPEAQQALARAMEVTFWLGQAFNAAVGAADAFWADTPGVVTTGVTETAPEEPAEPASEPEEAPKRGRGRPRTRSASERAVTEYYDEEDGVWVRAGRGRPPKDAKVRKVDPDTGEEV